MLAAGIEAAPRNYGDAVFNACGPTEGGDPHAALPSSSCVLALPQLFQWLTILANRVVGCPRSSRRLGDSARFVVSLHRIAVESAGNLHGLEFCGPSPPARLLLPGDDEWSLRSVWNAPKGGSYAAVQDLIR